MLQANASVPWACQCPHAGRSEDTAGSMVTIAFVYGLLRSADCQCQLLGTWNQQGPPNLPACACRWHASVCPGCNRFPKAADRGNRRACTFSRAVLPSSPSRPWRQRQFRQGHVCFIERCLRHDVIGSLFSSTMPYGVHAKKC